MKNIKQLVSAIILFVFSMVAYGQDKINTPAAFETFKDRSQWMYTNNAAGLLLDKPIDYAEVKFSYDSHSGSFHRPQTGEKINDLKFDVEGAVFVGNVYAWGKFNYTRSNIKDTQFNASIIDPYRDMPYMVADTNMSKWNNQIYDLQFKVVTPKIWNKLSLGLEGSYNAASGAKQRDIRTENYFYILQVKPGIVYSINNNHHIGANFDFQTLKEESNMSNVNVYVDQNYYALYGLGTATRGLGSGRTTNYEGNGIGGGFQYNYQGFFNLLFSSNYNYKVEDVKISFTLPEENATVKSKIWSGKLQLNKRLNKTTHYLTLNYADKKIDGIEAITQYDNTENQSGYVTIYKDIRSKYKFQQASLDYDFTIDRDLEYNWKFGIGVKYTNKEDVYLTPRSEKNAENLIAQFRIKKNFILSDDVLKRRVLLGADYSYNNNLSGGYSYNGSHPEYIVVTQFEQTDTDYLNSNFYSLGANLTYSQKIKKDILANLFAKAEFRYTKATSYEFGNRNRLQISIGCNF